MPATLLAAHRRSLETMLSLNAQAQVGRIERMILDGIDEQGRRYLARIAAHERSPIEGPFGTLGTFGENGHAPAIRDLVRQSAFHRARAKEERRRGVGVAA